MKLAEALQERAELNSRINSIRERLADNIIVQDGDMPAEDPNELRVQLENTIMEMTSKELEYMMQQAVLSRDAGNLFDFVTLIDESGNLYRQYDDGHRERIIISGN